SRQALRGTQSAEALFAIVPQRRDLLRSRNESAARRLCAGLLAAAVQSRRGVHTAGRDHADSYLFLRSSSRLNRRIDVEPFAIAGLLAILFALPARAGLYSPVEPLFFEITPDGFATPIQFTCGFESMVAGMREVARVPRSPDEPPNQIRKNFLDRVALRQ